MDLQFLAVIFIVGGALVWLTRKYAFAPKKGCGCGDECAAKKPTGRPETH
jgi:hypothetical protein